MSTDAPGSRKTRAIMFSDIKGYSKLMGQNEARALALLDEHNALVVPLVKRHGGQVLKFIGDSVLASYESAADAVLASIDVQQALAQRNAKSGPDSQIVVRIGVHVGDVVLKDDDVFGDGVNIAARLEPVAEPGGIAISQTVHDMVRAVPEIRTESMGTRALKNMGEPMQLYRVCFDGAPPATQLPPVTVDQGAKRLEQALAAPLPSATPAVLAPIDESMLSRRERRRLRRRREEAVAHPLEGWVWAAAAAVLASVALFRPEMWWMVFVALGPAKRAARILGRPRVQAALPAPVPEQAVRAPEPLPAEANPSEAAKVDALCQRLIADLAAGPSIAREVIQHPAKTIEALRTSCHALLQRSAQLRSLGGPAEQARLDTEREALAARTDAEPDEVARGRLQAAVDSLDDQRRQRTEMAHMATRLDAEYTRLYYTLQNLHTQVLRVRSVDLASDPGGDDLRQTVENLASEMDAVAQALEDINRPATVAAHSAPLDEPTGPESARVRIPTRT